MDKLPKEIIYNIIYMLKIKDIKEVINVNKKFYHISNKVILHKTCVLKKKQFENKCDYMFYIINFIKDELELSIYNKVNLNGPIYQLYYNDYVILTFKTSFVYKDIKITNKSPFIRKYFLSNII